MMGFQLLNPCLSTYQPQLALSHSARNATYARVPVSGCHLLGSFNGLEPGGPELTIRKWKREPEGGRERGRRKKIKTRGPKLWWSKRILLAEMQAYISLVRWLLSYYTGWNFIKSHNMDSLIHTRSLTLKRVTEGSYWTESKQIPFLTISVLRAACSSTRSWNKNW